MKTHSRTIVVIFITLFVLLLGILIVREIQHKKEKEVLTTKLNDTLSKLEGCEGAALFFREVLDQINKVKEITPLKPILIKKQVNVDDNGHIVVIQDWVRELALEHQYLITYSK